jgi:hypothetical protein
MAQMADGEGPINRRIEHLEDYFRKGMPGCRVEHDWKEIFTFVRFRLTKANGSSYLLDLERHGLLMDWKEDQIIRWLESSNWQLLLEACLGKNVPYFTNGGVKAHSWPG